MTYLPILCATFVVTSAQMYPQPKETARKESDTIIQNKNVNIIVNLDPKEMAKELWKVLESHLSNRTSHFTRNSRNVIRDLEKVVTPFVSTTRRGATPPSVFQVASEFDRITRRTLTRNAPAMNMIDEEIMTRDIVADMMVSLKMLLSNMFQSSKIDEADVPSRRTIPHNPVATDDEQDDYVDIRIKIRRKDLVNVLH